MSALQARSLIARPRSSRARLPLKRASGYAVVLSRGDQKGAVVSKHRTWEAANRAAQAGGCNYNIVRDGEEGA